MAYSQCALSHGPGYAGAVFSKLDAHTEETEMKKTRGGRMTAAKKRAAKAKGGTGLIKNRKAGKKIMKT